MPNRVLAKLKTRDIKGVEILDEGTWNVSTGAWAVTREVTDRILANFKALGELCVPPLKLGHSDSQQLLQEDGYPSAGWVERLYRSGTKILADFCKVPAAIADLIDVGGYRKTSVEVWKSFTVDGTAYQDVLTGVALLGNEIPAVATLKDITALYAKKALKLETADPEVRVVLYPGPKRRAELGTDTSIEDKRTAIDNALRDKFGGGINGYDWPWIVETFDTYVVARGSDGRNWQIPFTFGSDGSVALGAEIEVKQTWQPLTTTADLANNTAGTTGAKETGMLSKIAAALGLADTATETDCVTAIDALKAKATPAVAASALQERVLKLETDNGELTTKLARRDAKDAVDTAIRAKKLAPAQRVWAETYAEQDPKGFEAYVKDAPEVFRASNGTEAGADESDDDDGVAKVQAKTTELMKADPKLTHGEAQIRASRALATAAQ